MNSKVAIGLRAKTGRAIAVVLGGSPDAPAVLAKTEIKLIDPKIPETAQPYHVVMELPWEESQRAVQKFARAIERVARKAVADLVKQNRSSGTICGVGIVGAPDRDLSRIGNFHIRAHAAEGVLFRKVLNLAAESNGLKWRIFPDKEFEPSVAAELGSKAARVRKQISELGRIVPAPWRTDEKQAATAAWLVLHR
jgi:hypothetical protein